MIKNVLILNRNSAVLFEGMALCDNFQRDPETNILIADCKLSEFGNKTILVWKIEESQGIWQGWWI